MVEKFLLYIREFGADLGVSLVWSFDTEAKQFSSDFHEIGEIFLGLVKIGSD